MCRYGLESDHGRRCYSADVGRNNLDLAPTAVWHGCRRFIRVDRSRDFRRCWRISLQSVRACLPRRALVCFRKLLLLQGESCFVCELGRRGTDSITNYRNLHGILERFCCRPVTVRWSFKNTSTTRRQARSVRMIRHRSASVSESTFIDLFDSS